MIEKVDPYTVYYYDDDNEAQSLEIYGIDGLVLYLGDSGTKDITETVTYTTYYVTGSTELYYKVYSDTSVLS